MERCGFLLGRSGVGTEVRPVPNVSPDQQGHFVMLDQGILNVYAEADAQDLDVLAVFHSHPTSEAIPSPDDLAVPDIDPALLIVSLKDGQPRARAWRITMPFVGQRDAVEVLLHLSEDGQPFTMAPPRVPHALTRGNRVTLEYRAVRSAVPRTLRARVKNYTGLNTEEPSLVLDSDSKNAPGILPISRIQKVLVEEESPLAKRNRQRLAILTRRLAFLLSEGDLNEAAQIVAILSAALPDTMAVGTAKQ